MSVKVTLRLLNDKIAAEIYVDGEDASEVVRQALAASDAFMPAPERGQTFEEKVMTGAVATTPAPKTKAKKPPVMVVDSGKKVDPTGDPTAPPANISTGEPRQDPANPDPLDDPFTAAEAPVTDKEVSDAIIRAKARLGTVDKIKALIGTSGVKHYSEIPQGARKTFIASLEALK